MPKTDLIVIDNTKRISVSYSSECSIYLLGCGVLACRPHLLIEKLDPLVLRHAHLSKSYVKLVKLGVREASVNPRNPHRIRKIFFSSILLNLSSEFLAFRRPLSFGIIRGFRKVLEKLWFFVGRLFLLWRIVRRSFVRTDSSGFALRDWMVYFPCSGKIPFHLSNILLYLWCCCILPLRLLRFHTLCHLSLVLSSFFQRLFYHTLSHPQLVLDVLKPLIVIRSLFLEAVVVFLWKNGISCFWSLWFSSSVYWIRGLLNAWNYFSCLGFWLLFLLIIKCALPCRLHTRIQIIGLRFILRVHLSGT